MTDRGWNSTVICKHCPQGNSKVTKQAVLYVGIAYNTLGVLSIHETNLVKTYRHILKNSQIALCNMLPKKCLLQ